MTRWDSPLFTVPYEDTSPPCEAIWEAMIGSEGRAKVVRPNQATVLVGCRFTTLTSHSADDQLQKPAAEPDYLYELDRNTQETVNIILEWQKDHLGEGVGELTVGDATLELPPNPVSLPQLQRIRRQFISLNRQHILPINTIRGSFVMYLNDNL